MLLLIHAVAVVYSVADVAVAVTLYVTRQWLQYRKCVRIVPLLYETRKEDPNWVWVLMLDCISRFEQSLGA